MRSLLFVAAAALVFAGTIGTASAEEPFATLEADSDERFDTLAGVPAAPLDQDILAATAGRSIFQRIRDGQGNEVLERFIPIAGIGGSILVDATLGVAVVNITVFLQP